MPHGVGDGVGVGVIPTVGDGVGVGVGAFVGVGVTPAVGAFVGTGVVPGVGAPLVRFTTKSVTDCPLCRVEPGGGSVREMVLGF